MNYKAVKQNISVALLFAGSAILLISCEQGVDNDPQDVKTLMTQQSDTLTLLTSENGMKAYRFYAPLMERYEFASEPYMEFRKGVSIETYQDSTQIVESTLIADYAIFLEVQKIWEAKGNVVATNANGQILETQQLFWNQKTHKIYSNVDSKVTQGSDVIVGIGFESDESFNDFTFRRPKGKVTVDVEPTDSLSTDQSATPTGVPTFQPAVPPASSSATSVSPIKPITSSVTNTTTHAPSQSSGKEFVKPRPSVAPIPLGSQTDSVGK